MCRQICCKTGSSVYSLMGGIIGAGAAFDDAAGEIISSPDREPRTDATTFTGNLYPSVKALKPIIEIKRRIGKLGPFAQRQPMLHFLFGPLVRYLLEFGIAGEDFAQIARIVAAIMLDHAGRFGERTPVRARLCCDRMRSSRYRLRTEVPMIIFSQGCLRLRWLPDSIWISTFGSPSMGLHIYPCRSQNA